MRRHWGHACLCIIIYIYDLQGIWMSPLPIQSKIDDRYKSFKTRPTPTCLTVPQPSNRLSPFVYKVLICILNAHLTSYFPEDMHKGSSADLILFNLWLINVPLRGQHQMPLCPFYLTPLPLSFTQHGTACLSKLRMP